MTTKNIIDNELWDDLVEKIKKLNNLNQMQIRGSISDISKMKLLITKLEKILIRWPHLLNKILISKERISIAQQIPLNTQDDAKRSNDAEINMGIVIDNILLFIAGNIEVYKHPLTRGGFDELDKILKLTLEKIFDEEANKKGVDFDMCTEMVSNDKTQKYILRTVITGTYNLDYNKCDISYTTLCVEKVINPLANNEEFKGEKYVGEHYIFSKNYPNITDAVNLHLNKYNYYLNTKNYKFYTNWEIVDNKIVIGDKTYSVT
ncbi:MAG: hypothetical protein Edafosvirus1_91 [Edafosvirus sp.]|uniref:Uncharacterized protein n=1 Tax=Edafosvirus sp. TaxID=2487765 RepID=A0A3G4ZS79_9VIRU|nr:MAG: hypothetical protein Edafosvirus1_91 [Edafosvirus sp.]